LDETTLKNAFNPNVSYQWSGTKSTMQSLKNNTLALAVTGNEVNEENKGDKWKKGGKVFGLPKKGTNGLPTKTFVDTFTLTKLNSLKVLTLKPEGGLEMKGI
jgi:hypothetical protein